VDLIYLAALIDTVGTIKIEYSKLFQDWIVLVWITHPSFPLIQDCQKLGAYIVQLKNKMYRAKWRNAKAYRLLLDLRHHLKLKRDQADICLEYLMQKEQNPDKNLGPIYQLKLRQLKKQGGVYAV